MVNGEVIVIVEVQEVMDDVAFQAYRAQARRQLLERGGAIMGRGGELFEGTPALAGPILVQRWPSEQAFREWQSSEDYRPLLALRKRAARLRVIIVSAES